jgi:hypothetical protein
MRRRDGSVRKGHEEEGWRRPSLLPRSDGDVSKITGKPGNRETGSGSGLKNSKTGYPGSGYPVFTGKPGTGVPILFNNIYILLKLYIIILGLTQ